MLTSNRPATLRRSASVRGGLAPWRVKRVADYIESNIGSNFRVADLADSVQLSRAHFAREFKKTFGQTPFAYVKARRVRHAQDIMANTQEPLSQIALACGMCDQSHFVRVFSRVVGMTPGQWRRQILAGPMSAHGNFGIKLGKTADIAHSAVGPLCAS